MPRAPENGNQLAGCAVWKKSVIKKTSDQKMVSYSVNVFLSLQSFITMNAFFVEDENLRSVTCSNDIPESDRSDCSQDLNKTTPKKIVDICLEAGDKRDVNKSLTDLSLSDKGSERHSAEMSRSCEDLSKSSEVLLFGEDLNKHPIEGSIELPSDEV